MQMRMMYGTRDHLDQCEFCPGTVYFLTDVKQIWFDAPDTGERICMTLDPDKIETDLSISNCRISALESSNNNIEQFLQDLSSVSLPHFNPNRW